MLSPLWKPEKSKKKISLAKWIFACYFHWSRKLSTATFFLFLPKKLFLLFLQVSNSSSSRLGFLFFAPHNNSREWRESKGKKVFHFLWFVNSTLVCLIIARFKVKIYANFTRGKSRLLEGKERKKKLFLVSNAKRGCWMRKRIRCQNWTKIEEDFCVWIC